MDLVFDFFYKNGFLFELIIAYTPLIMFFHPRKRLVVRLLCCFFGCVLYSFVFTLLMSFASGPVLLPVLNILYFASTAALTVLGLRICCDMDGWLALFFGITAYLFEHIFYRLKSVYQYIFYSVGCYDPVVSIACYIGLTIAFYLFVFLTLRKSFKSNPSFLLNNRKVMITAILATFLAIVLCVISKYSYDNYHNLDDGIFIVETVFAISCCTLILNNMFYGVRILNLQAEHEVVTTLYNNAKKQYEASKQNVELLNIKYHDLKYYINARDKGGKGGVSDNNGGVSDGTSDGTSDGAIQETLRLLSDYETFLKTGNEALDVIITEKTMQCRSKGMDVNCIADGSLLNKLEDVDIYTLFGNALDNAAESILRENCPDKTIELFVTRIGNMAKIEISNSVVTPPKIVDGLPVTLKADKNNHGYGTKSMQRIVEKYQGYLVFSCKDSRFSVNIIFNL